MTRRALRTALVCAAASLLAALLAASPAPAAFTTPEYEMTFTGSGEHQLGEPTAVAVDEQTHDVYVADRANHRVEKFDPEGNFLLSFGDFTNPTAVAVDNSDSASKGSVYVAEGSAGGGVGTIAKFDSSGQPVTAWGTAGELTVTELRKMTVSPFTGDIWVLERYETTGTDSKIVSLDPSGVQRFKKESWINPGGDGVIAVDSHDNFWYADQNRNPLKADVARFPENERHALGGIYPAPAMGFATNPANSDVLVVLNDQEVVVFEQTCEPTKGYCTPKESFGAGNLSSPGALAVDGSDYSVYVAVSGGIAVFRSKVVPDVLPKPASVGLEDAVVTAHLDPLGEGDITDCFVEYGTDTSYGTTLPCDQPLPITTASDATAHLSGLSTETTYHYRFRATNGNGTSSGPDLRVTPHWVKGLETGDATDIAAGTATLHGELNPDGQPTHYYFEWGETQSYGHQTPDLPGTQTSAAGLTPVEATLGGMLTAQTTYHYRLVGVNALGTSHGADREFTTLLAEPPQIAGLSATPTGLGTATLSGQVNPGFGDTAYMFQYGTGTDYGRSTPIVGPIAHDGTFHSVSAQVSGLEPATTYHFRLIAFNFSKYVASQDLTFTTLSPPAVAASSAVVLDAHTVRLSGRAGGALGGMTVHFDYGPGAAYGSRTADAPVGGDGTASVTLGGLAAASTYHFRAVAESPLGQALGADQTFTTPQEPTAPGGHPKPRKCKRGFVRRKGRCVRKRHRHRHRKHRHGDRQRGQRR
jgi:hypothetical protein